MRAVDALVSEVAIYLMDLFEGADDQPLQVKLRRDPCVQVDVERIVMSREWPSRGTGRQRRQHRGLDFHVAALVEEPAYQTDDRGARLEHAANFSVGDQISVPLAVAQLHLMKTVVLVRRRNECLSQERE